MRRIAGVGRWVWSGALLLALGGCVTNQQLLDFGRTELARSVADAFGRAFQILVQSST